MHHFAHHSGHNCEYGYESSLHLAAKDILSKAKKLTIPPVYVEFPESYKNKELISEAREITIDCVELEKRFGDIVPDIVVYASGKQLFIEIFVTHKIDDTKLQKLQRADISTIEIDLSRKSESITSEELTEILLDRIEDKVWKYNSLSQRFYNRYLNISDKYKKISRGYAIHIDNCPIKSRAWKGRPYANFIDDCLGCDYCVSVEDDYIYCAGKSGITTIKDFDIPPKIRIENSKKRVTDLKDSSFVSGVCPNCGGELVERESKYGNFWGCSNYPHCRFIASVNRETGEITMKS